MIGSVRGKVIELKPGYILLETVAGVGLEIFVPLSSYSEIENQRNNLFLYTALRIREEQITLYGFLSKKELYVFEKLTTVSGVGSKIALSLVSALGVDSLISAINEGNVGRLKSIPGIGAKTAQRIILELTGKLTIENLNQEKLQFEEDLVSALVNLGYQLKIARETVNSIMSEHKEQKDFAVLLKICLKKLAR